MALSENPTLEEIINEVERLNNLIVSRGGSQTISPSTSNKVLSKGYYKGDITILGDSDLISSNIRSGKNIFGVNGSLIEGVPNGKRWASGKVNATGKTMNFTDSNDRITNEYYLEIPSLTFEPSIIIYISESKYGGIGVVNMKYSVSNTPTPFCVLLKQYNTGSSYEPVLTFKADSKMFTSTGLKLPSAHAYNYNWIAYE